MIERFSHVTLYVLNQEDAKNFYVDKLGFAVRIDFRMDNGFRWLTVSPQAQHDSQIVLLPRPANFTPAPGTALVFQTSDCRQTVADLAAKGVTIVSQPTEHFHGIEAIFADNSGNTFTLHQPKG